MLDENNRQRIINEETSKFLNDGFAPLDLSSFPALNQPAADDQASADGDANGFNRLQVAGANKLKQFAANPDLETLERIAQESGNAELQDQVREDIEEQEAIKFVKSHPTYLKDDDNYETLREYLNERNLPFTAENLHAAFTILCRQGRMKMPRGTSKALSRGEQLHVISLTQNGQVEDALTTYLQYALPDAEETWGELTDFLADPSTIDVRNRAVGFVWIHARPNFQDSTEFRTFEQKFFRNRPLKSLALMDACYEAFQQAYKNEVRNRLIHGNETNTPPTPREIDDLDDEQIDALYHKTAKQHARQTGRQPGVLV